MRKKVCAMFVDYISLKQQRTLVDKARFFSLQIDGSTDSGNVEDEVFVVVFCDPYSIDSRVHVHNNF